MLLEPVLPLSTTENRAQLNIHTVRRKSSSVIKFYDDIFTYNQAIENGRLSHHNALKPHKFDFEIGFSEFQARIQAARTSKIIRILCF